MARPPEHPGVAHSPDAMGRQADAVVGGRRCWVWRCRVWRCRLGDRPFLDTAALPPAARPLYSAFLDSNTHRVFAMDRAGHAGWFSGEYDTPAKVQDGALKLCVEHGGTDCQPYAVDLAVVWPGPRVAPAAAARFPGGHDQLRLLPRRPLPVARAGAGGGRRGLGAWRRRLRRFARRRTGPGDAAVSNNAGFDIVRYDRAPLVGQPRPRRRLAAGGAAGAARPPGIAG